MVSDSASFLLSNAVVFAIVMSLPHIIIFMQAAIVNTHINHKVGEFASTIVHKWKNHFYEMKGDVRMSLHEKERNKKMPTPRHKVTHNPIPTSLFCFNMLFVCLFVMNALGKANSTTS